MKIIVRGQIYYVDEHKLVDYVKSTVTEKMGERIILPNDVVIDLTSKGLLMTGLRQVLSFLIPLLSYAAEKVGTHMPDKRMYGDSRGRHLDVIPYVIDAYFGIVEKACHDLVIDTKVNPYVEDYLQVVDAQMYKEEPELLISGNMLPISEGGSENGSNSIS